MSRRPFPLKALCPMITAFDADEEIDEKAIYKQTLRLAKAGLGICVLGTNGEMGHLSAEERKKVISISRKALDENGFKDVALVSGTGDNSTKLTIQRCIDAKEAGADYALVIAPGYFNFVIGQNKEALKRFFKEVCDASPIPVMIYNFPGASSGIDLDSDTIIELSEHPNCCGCKLTCANIAKGYRIALHVHSQEYRARHKLEFQVLSGYSDFLTAAMVARHDGAITGTGNIYPKVIVKLFKTIEAAQKDPSKWGEAQELQDLITAADNVIVKGGVAGTKAILNTMEQGLGGIPRGPLIASSASGSDLIKDAALAKAMKLESTL